MTHRISWRALRRQLLSERGTLARAILYLELDRLPPLEGTVVDVGAGVVSSYWRHLRLAAGSRLIRLDVMPEKRPDVAADVQRGLPFRDGSIDAIVLIYVLEHVYDYRRTITELGRVLRAGGLLYMSVPFLIGVHREQGEDFFVNDYFRYSDAALERMLISEGKMRDVRVVSHGGLFMTVLNLLQPAVKSYLALSLAAGVAELFDRALDARFPLNRDKWVMQYFVAARRS